MMWGFRSGRGSNLPFLSLQPAKHILLHKEFPKMSPSAFSILGPPGPGGQGRGSNLDQNLPWTGGDVCAKFHQDRCRGLEFH